MWLRRATLLAPCAGASSRLGLREWPTAGTGASARRFGPWWPAALAGKMRIPPAPVCLVLKQRPVRSADQYLTDRFERCTHVDSSPPPSGSSATRSSPTSARCFRRFEENPKKTHSWSVWVRLSVVWLIDFYETHLEHLKHAKASRFFPAFHWRWCW